MDSPDGSHNCEGVIAFTLEKPPGNDLGSDTIFLRKERPTSRPKLLHLFPLTPADEPAKKKRFFPQEGLPLTKHNPATDLPRNCRSFIPFSLENVSNDCGSDTDRLRVRPMLLCMFPLTPADGQEELQMRHADWGKDITNRSDSNKLGPPDQDLCALNLPTSGSLEDTTPENPLRNVSLVDPSDISPRVTDQHFQAPPEVPHFGPELTNLSNSRAVIPFEEEPTSLSNGREVVPFEPESMNLFNWAPNGSGFLSSHLTRRWGASRHRTLVCAQPARAMSNNDKRRLAQSPAQSAQPQAQPQALRPTQPRILPQAEPRVQPPAFSQAQSPAQPLAQCRAQPRVQSPAQPRARRQAQAQVQSPAQPLARRQAQPRVQSPAQPHALPSPQVRAQAPAQPREKPRVQAPAQPRAKPRVQAPAQPRAQCRAQPRVQPQAQAPAQSRVQHGPRPKSSPYKGVTHYKRTGRWEAHIWNDIKDDKRQIYLGASFTAVQAARAYDRAAICFRGVGAEINFPLADYQSELPQLAAVRRAQLVLMLREQSAGKGTPHLKYPHP